ncbi:transposase family protein [Streptomyces sudanensis]|uniref:transposase family protein n=1 Tax=Streptomyces sudanensis TaxID=436397 RepID=UPI0020CE11B2|nr:transposase family protein [Streptomyces sudanensis]MCP9988270.1 transposase family protein [Streptomyces sudanensis]
MAEVVDHLGADGKTAVIGGTGIRARRPDTGRKGRDTLVSGKNKQNAVKTIVVADSDDQVLFRNPAEPGSCANATCARRPGLVRLLADGPALEILADADRQGLGVQTGGRVVTPPHRTFKNPPPGTRRHTSGSARRPPHGGSGSSTVSPTRRAGGPWPTVSAAAGT